MPVHIPVHPLNVSYTCVVFRDAERTRDDQYHQELQDMKERVQKRPLLFEQQKQVSTNTRQGVKSIENKIGCHYLTTHSTRCNMLHIHL
jgi:hypothetical protein